MTEQCAHAANWAEIPLRHVLSVNPRVPSRLRGDGERLVTFYPMEAIGEDGSMDPSQRRTVGDVLQGYTYLANGDVLFAKVTPCFENGKAATVIDVPTGDAFATTEVTVLRPSALIDQRFLGYVVRTSDFRERAISEMTGAGGLKRVPEEYVRRYKLGLPTLSVQESIADFLDRDTAKIDALIAKQEQLIATLQEDRIATITRAVTEGLRNESCSAFSSPYLSLHPKSWVATKLKYHAAVQTGITLGKGTTPDACVTVPYLRVANVQAGSVNLTEVKELAVDRGDVSSYLLRADDVLMTEGGDIDKLGRGCRWNGEIDPCIHQNHVFAVRCRNSLTSKFLVYLLETAQARNYFMLTAKKTTNLASTNSTTLKALPIALPTISEQNEIVEFLDDRATQFEQLTTAAGRMIVQLREYRAALITDAVTGKIDVREMV